MRFWAAARAAAGAAEDRIEVAGTITLAELLAEILRRHGAPERLRAVLPTCSVLIGDRPVASADPATVLVGPGDSVEFLPPFAGG